MAISSFAIVLSVGLHIKIKDKEIFTFADIVYLPALQLLCTPLRDKNLKTSYVTALVNCTWDSWIINFALLTMIIFAKSLAVFRFHFGPPLLVFSLDNMATLQEVLWKEEPPKNTSKVYQNNIGSHVVNVFPWLTIPSSRLTSTNMLEKRIQTSLISLLSISAKQ